MQNPAMLTATRMSRIRLAVRSGTSRPFSTATAQQTARTSSGMRHSPLRQATGSIGVVVMGHFMRALRSGWTQAYRSPARPGRHATNGRIAGAGCVPAPRVAGRRSAAGTGRSALLEVFGHQLVPAEQLVEIRAVALGQARRLADIAAGDLQDL